MNEHQPAHEPSAEQEPTASPRIYVASLSDYNDGRLHGAWLDAAQDPDTLGEEVQAMLATSPTDRRYGQPAEEWAIHDYEGFGPIRLSEFEPLERVAALARGISRHGDAFAWWWTISEADGTDDHDLTGAFEDAYLGHYDSAADYGRQLLDDLGYDPDALPGVPESLQPYVRIDTDAWVRDMQYAGELHITPATEGVHVFTII